MSTKHTKDLPSTEYLLPIKDPQKKRHIKTWEAFLGLFKQAVEGFEMTFYVIRIQGNLLLIDVLKSSMNL